MAIHLVKDETAPADAGGLPPLRPLRFYGPAAWAELAPEHQARIGALALELVQTWHLQGRVFEDGLDERLGRAAEAADVLLVDLLSSEVREAIENATELPGLSASAVRALAFPPGPSLDGPEGAPQVASALGPICRTCGCSERDSCQPLGCSWVEPDLCSSCLPEGR